jgi:hypothetical protein
MFKRGKFFGIPIIYIVAGIAAFLFRDKLKPLFEKVQSLFTKKDQTPTA